MRGRLLGRRDHRRISAASTQAPANSGKSSASCFAPAALRCTPASAPSTSLNNSHAFPLECDYASEFRYRNAPLFRNTLFFVMSQSGETIDTLAALREAKRKGYRVLAINNVVGSSIAREADGGIYQHVGPEVGVASTKAFTSQLLIGSMLALYIGRMRDMSFGRGVRIRRRAQTSPGSRSQSTRTGPANQSHRPALCTVFRHAFPWPDVALPDRAGRCTEAEGNLLTSMPRATPPPR